MTNNALTKLPFNVAVTGFDNSNMSTANNRYTADVTGVYSVFAGIVGQGNFTGELRIYKNGALYKLGHYGNGGTQLTMIVEALVPLANTDYVEIWYYDTSGQALDVTNYGAASNSFSCYRVE